MRKGVFRARVPNPENCGRRRPTQVATSHSSHSVGVDFLDMLNFEIFGANVTQP